jgi:hypothetical protein
MSQESRSLRNCVAIGFASDHGTRDADDETPYSSPVPLNVAVLITDSFED